MALLKKESLLMWWYPLQVKVGGAFGRSVFWICEWFAVLWGAAVECIFLCSDETRPTSSARMFFVFFVSRFLCFVNCSVLSAQIDNSAGDILGSDISSDNSTDGFDNDLSDGS